MIIITSFSSFLTDNTTSYKIDSEDKSKSKSKLSANIDFAKTSKINTKNKNLNNKIPKVKEDRNLILEKVYNKLTNKFTSEFDNKMKNEIINYFQNYVGKDLTKLSSFSEGDLSNLLHHMKSLKDKVKKFNIKNSYNQLASVHGTKYGEFKLYSNILNKTQ